MSLGADSLPAPRPLGNYLVDEEESLRRDLFLLELPAAAAMPTELNLSTPYFLVFSVWDSTEASEQEVRLVARRLIDSGCVSLSAFGSGCEIFHDIFAQEVLKNSSEITGDLESTINTTWHSGDSFDDALWFGLFTAFASENYADQCGANLVLSIGKHEYRDDLIWALENVERFNDRVIDALPD